MLADGVLILSHCGFSFVEDLIAAISQRKLHAYVLSSRPLPEHANRLQSLEMIAKAVYSVDAYELTTEDVKRTIESLQQQGVCVRGCISVWEGYRALMAHANILLGVGDLLPVRAASLRNKLDVRNALHAAQLSRTTARELTPTVLRELQMRGGAYFVKPMYGIASYGAFRLKPETSWSMLEAIATEAKADTVYVSALGTDIKFIAEEYVSGIEFSFEVLVAAGQPFVVGIHEKCELTEVNGTVLEDSCTSPPSSIGARESGAGIAWITAIVRHLALDWGCFHIEARFDGEHWDLIEINPRVGGSLISPSVKALNGEASLLDLWLDLLLQQTVKQLSLDHLDRLMRLSYSSEGEAPSENATFFRVYFASTGRIDDIEIKQLSRQPLVTQVLLKVGDEIDPASREVFLGQLLWSMTRKERDAELDELLAASSNAIAVRYQFAEPALGV